MSAEDTVILVDVMGLRSSYLLCRLETGLLCSIIYAVVVRFLG
jgi:hypothetical protein